MTIPIKKLKSGFEMPAFGLGTWTMGGKLEADTVNDESDIEAIKTALKAGITHIDTAEKYAAGHAEELIAEATRDIDRAKLFITSKVAKEHLTYDGVKNALERSLRRLQTDYIDLYLIHAPNLDIPLEDTIRAIDELISLGKVRNIGVSNFSTKRLKEARSLSNNRIVTNQVIYNLIMREPEEEGLLEYCQQNDVLLTAFMPVQRGVLVKRGIPILDEMADKYGKTPAQVAINWLISQPNVVTISKMDNEGHLEENLGALGWSLTKEDIEKLRKEFPGKQSSLDFPLR